MDRLKKDEVGSPEGGLDILEGCSEAVPDWLAGT